MCSAASSTDEDAFVNNLHPKQRLRAQPENTTVELGQAQQTTKSVECSSDLESDEVY